MLLNKLNGAVLPRVTGTLSDPTARLDNAGEKGQMCSPGDTD